LEEKPPVFRSGFGRFCFFVGHFVVDGILTASWGLPWNFKRLDLVDQGFPIEITEKNLGITERSDGFGARSQV